jgi:selenocysteine lyase/cysteine desulfurase
VESTVTEQRDLLIENVRAQFTGLKQSLYLNSAAESLFLESHRDALLRYAALKERGSAGRKGCSDVEARCRSLVADFIKVDSVDVAFLASTSRGIDVAVKSIDWRPGDNVVVPDSEFPTALSTAWQLRGIGVEERIVRCREGELLIDSVADQIDNRTRLVVVSTVSFKTGFRVDIDSLAQVAHDHGALIFVDAIQALGVVPVDARSADFLCAGTYKWQLGAHGLASFYVNPNIADEIRVPYCAYRGVKDIFPTDIMDGYEPFADARRFEEGMPNYPGMFVLENGLLFLRALGIERVHTHTADLVSQLMDGLEELGVTPLTTRNRANRAGIVSFETAHFDELLTLLEEEGIYVWARDGRVRMSPYIYNTSDDIALFLERLKYVSDCHHVPLQ